MSDTIDLSIIIPVYGTEKYIDKCLLSVLEATKNLNAEILVINDGTKDNAGIIAKRYASEYPEKIVYYEKLNGGLSDTKNYGLNRARGLFITFLDSDDYIEPEMYEEMLSLVQKDKSDCVVCDMILDYEDTKQSVYEKCAAKNRKDLFHGLIDTMLMASSCNKIIKKELYEGLSFPTGKNNEDIAVTPIAMGRSQNLSYLPKGFYHYVQRNGSIQNSEFSKKRFVILDVCELALKRANELISPERFEMLKGALYVFQILSIPFWVIRKEPFKNRYKLLKEYMDLVNQKYPDFHDNKEVREYGKWGSNILVKIYRIVCLWLNKHRLYWLLCVLWSLAKPFGKE